MKREGREKSWKSVNIKNNKCYKKLYENWEKRKEMIMMWTLIWLNKSVTIINATLQLLDIYRYRLKIKSIKWSWGHTIALHLILPLIRGLLTTSWSQKNYMMIVMWPFIPSQLQIYSSSSNQTISYITWSRIKEALTIVWIKTTNFPLEGKFRKKGCLKFTTWHLQL